MFPNRSIVSPMTCHYKYLPGTVAIMIATERDFMMVNKFSAMQCIIKKKLYTSWIHIYEVSNGARYSIVGPFIGASYATMLLETLLTWGVKQIIFLGWCGAISDNVKSGDIILPNAAIIDEGTSTDYCARHGSLVFPSPNLELMVKNFFKINDRSFHEGSIWTTDAVFRETIEKVDFFRGMGALGVEMELSAILSVSKFRSIQAAGILLVSDTIRGHKWYPGFKTKEFNQARTFICKGINNLCCELI